MPNATPGHAAPVLSRSIYCLAVAVLLHGLLSGLQVSVAEAAPQEALSVKTLRAQMIQLVDSKGRVLAALEGGNGEPTMLRLFGPDKGVRLCLSSGEAGASLVIPRVTSEEQMVYVGDESAHGALHPGALSVGDNGKSAVFSQEVGQKIVKLIMAEGGPPPQKKK